MDMSPEQRIAELEMLVQQQGHQINELRDTLREQGIRVVASPERNGR